MTKAPRHGPRGWLGTAWLPIGLALGAWAFWRGRLGLASLAVSPYLLPYYFAFGFLELRQRRREDVELGRSQL